MAKTMQRIFEGLAGRVTGWSPTPSASASRMASTEISMYVVVCPAYDGLTRAMARWLEGVRQSLFQDVDVVWLLRELATHEELFTIIESRRTLGVRWGLIFYGHGRSDCFLTFLGTEISRSEEPDGGVPLCGLEQLASVSPVAVFSYCCHSGQVLGPRLSESAVGNYFLGYDDRIPFIIGDGVAEYEAAFERPWTKLLLGILNGNYRDHSLRPQLLELYREERKNWLSKLATDPMSHWVLMYLDRHMDRLCAFGREPYVS